MSWNDLARNLDTYNDFDDEHYGYVDGINDGSKPMREPCPECAEDAIADWDHLPGCLYFREMIDLPF